MKTIARFLCALVLFAGIFSVARAASPLLADSSVVITTVTAETSVKLLAIDLSNVRTSMVRGDLVAVEIEAVTGATGPGADRTITVHYGFANLGTYTAAQMATATTSQVMALPATGATTAVFTLPVSYISGKFLYLYLDHTAFDASASVTLTVRYNGISIL